MQFQNKYKKGSTINFLILENVGFFEIGDKVDILGLELGKTTGIISVDRKVELLEKVELNLDVMTHNIQVMSKFNKSAKTECVNLTLEIFSDEPSIEKVDLETELSYDLFSVTANLVSNNSGLIVSGEMYDLSSFGESLGNATIVGQVIKTSKLSFKKLPDYTKEIKPFHTLGLALTIDGLLINSPYTVDSINDLVHVLAYYEINGEKYSNQINSMGVDISKKVRAVSKACFPVSADYPNEARVTPIQYSGIFPVNKTNNVVTVEFEAIFPKSIVLNNLTSVSLGNNLILTGRYVQVPINLEQAV
jgi:hypothetical protein